MNSMDKTVKLAAYSADAKEESTPVNATQDKKLAEELAGKINQLEEEKSRSLANLNVIGQLGESLKQEQAKSAELTKRISGLEDNQNKLIDTSKKLMDRQEAKLAEQQSQLAEQQATMTAQQAKVTEQQAKIAGLETQLAAQEAKLAGLQSSNSEQESKFSNQAARIKTLVEALEKISTIATAAK